MKGYVVNYLGNDVTAGNLLQVLKTHPPALMFTYLPQGHLFPYNEVLQLLRQGAPASTLIIGFYPQLHIQARQEGSEIYMAYNDALKWLTCPGQQELFRQNGFVYTPGTD